MQSNAQVEVFKKNGLGVSMEGLHVQEDPNGEGIQPTTQEVVLRLHVQVVPDGEGLQPSPRRDGGTCIHS